MRGEAHRSTDSRTVRKTGRRRTKAIELVGSKNLDGSESYRIPLHHYVVVVKSQLVASVPVKLRYFTTMIGFSRRLSRSELDARRDGGISGLPSASGLASSSAASIGVRDGSPDILDF